MLEFYRKRLGVPFELGGGSLERDDILVSCFTEPYEPEPLWDGESTYYLGADQGNEIQVLICKVERHSRIPKIVHIELIPMHEGFERLSQLIQLYHVRRGVVDANPNRHEAMRLTEKFPGRILISDYTEQREPWRTASQSKTSGKSTLTNVYINRTTAFDGLMKSIRDGAWGIYGNPANLPHDVELLIDHVTALKRDIEVRRTASGEVQVPVYRKLRADHLAHAWLYMDMAITIDAGRGARVAIVNKPTVDMTVANETANEDEMRQNIGYLAEVPRDQLTVFVENSSNKNMYSSLFPLNYKLQRLMSQYDNDADGLEAAIKAANKLLRP
jgi:hypothetical protein